MNAVLSADSIQSTTLPAMPQRGASLALAMPGNGNLDSYIRAVHRVPMLSVEEEQRLARELRDHDSVDAARRLVMSHLRPVVSVARQYRATACPTPT